MKALVLKALELDLSVLRYPAGQIVPPEFYMSEGFLNIVRTDEEVSVVCESTKMPPLAPEQNVGGWKAFKVQGPLDFSLTGILAAISSALAEKKISIFAISTFDTDYILVKKESFLDAQQALSEKFTLA